ncbi:MAG: SipW-dependent-type signal peptide-containing protein, partial [Clostridia bacterium]|nr:SipW-dependent-type signal peptide-containing protein [Clostridia bacterium]
MTKTKSTKRALLVSALALLLCVAMLIGSTYAWFTDSVTSAGNIIKSGTLDVTMEWADGKESPDSAVWADASKGAIFNNDKWEPGYTEVRHIKIANKGTLALKYQVKIAANGKVSDLAEVIDVYFVDPAVQVADRTELNGVAPIGTLAEVLAAMPGNTSGELLENEADTVTLALKMRESAGNEYQDKSIGTDFSVQLVATQATVESDSFDDQYDVDAEYPLVVSGKKALNEALTLPYDETNVQIVVPADAYAGNYAKVVTYENLTE